MDKIALDKLHEFKTHLVNLNRKMTSLGYTDEEIFNEIVKVFPFNAEDLEGVVRKCNFDDISHASKVRDDERNKRINETIVALIDAMYKQPINQSVLDSVHNATAFKQMFADSVLEQVLELTHVGPLVCMAIYDNANGEYLEYLKYSKSASAYKNKISNLYSINFVTQQQLKNANEFIMALQTNTIEWDPFDVVAARIYKTLLYLPESYLEILAEDIDIAKNINIVKVCNAKNVNMENQSRQDKNVNPYTALIDAIIECTSCEFRVYLSTRINPSTLSVIDLYLNLTADEDENGYSFDENKDEYVLNNVYMVKGSEIIAIDTLLDLVDAYRGELFVSPFVPLEDEKNN